jgi:hypothetical protein
MGEEVFVVRHKNNIAAGIGKNTLSEVQLAKAAEGKTREENRRAEPAQPILPEQKNISLEEKRNQKGVPFDRLADLCRDIDV